MCNGRLTPGCRMRIKQKCGPKGPSKWTQEVIEAQAKTMIEWYSNNPRALTLDGYAVSQGVWRQRLYEWATVNDSFSDALKLAESILAERAVQFGADSSIPPALSIFMAKNRGYTDRIVSEVSHSGSVSVGSLAQALGGSAQA